MARTNGARAGTLSFLILGILDDEPCSGYDLRRLFQDTPIGTFSDSPGSIYPALRALERRRLVEARTDRSRPLRPRRVYRVTPAGRTAFLAWLREPVTDREVSHDAELFGAKFAFMSGRLPLGEIRRLTCCYAEALGRHADGVRGFARLHARTYPVSARLALEGGAALLDARLAWVRRALRELGRSHAR